MRENATVENDGEEPSMRVGRCSRRGRWVREQEEETGNRGRETDLHRV